MFSKAVMERVYSLCPVWMFSSMKQEITWRRFGPEERTLKSKVSCLLVIMCDRAAVCVFSISSLFEKDDGLKWMATA